MAKKKKAEAMTAEAVAPKPKGEVAAPKGYQTGGKRYVEPVTGKKGYMTGGRRFEVDVKQ